MKSITCKESLCPAIIKTFHWAYNFLQWMNIYLPICRLNGLQLHIIKAPCCSCAEWTNWARTMWPLRVFYFTRITLVFKTLILWLCSHFFAVTWHVHVSQIKFNFLSSDDFFAIWKWHKCCPFYTIRSCINQSRFGPDCIFRSWDKILRFSLLVKCLQDPIYMTSTHRRQGERVLLEEIAVSGCRTQR